MNIVYIEKNGIQYPNIGKTEKINTKTSVGKYGRMAMNYLKEVKPHRLLEMKINGTMNETFSQVDKEANDMLLTLKKQLLSQNPIANPNDFLSKVNCSQQSEQFQRHFLLKKTNT